MSMLKQWTRHIIKRGQVGQSIVILALGMIGLIGFVGLTTDVSLLFVRYNNLRRAVDSAAIAAAGQVRQTEDGAVSDVLTRASLSARQFIEFHGLSPRNVWVEMCDNQPRQDFAPGQTGLQLEPVEIQDTQREYGVMVATLNDAIANNAPTETIQQIRGDVRDALGEYIGALVDYMADVQGVDPSDNESLADLLNQFDTIADAWDNLPTDENWNPVREIGDQLVSELRDAIGISGNDQTICPDDDVRKLVRVTAQVDSPTVFLRLLNIDTITLQASAVSETAVLDVVLVMDVSESMLFETNYEDWAQVNLGMGYVPPYLWDPANESATYSVAGRLMRAGFLPQVDTGVNQNRVHLFLMDMPEEDRYNPPPPNPSRFGSGGDALEVPLLWTGDITVPGVQFSSPRAGTWLEWFWFEYILGEWPYYINARLNFIDAPPPNGTGGPLQTPITNPLQQFETDRTQPSAQYRVDSFVPSTVNPARANHPREECRVRFYPFSRFLTMTEDWPRVLRDGDNSPITIAEYYAREGVVNAGNWPNFDNRNNPGAEQPRWSSFVPTYNFYGCCNDPTTGVRVSDGSPRYTAPNGSIIPNGDFVVQTGVADDGSPIFEPLGNRVPGQNALVGTSPDFDFSDLVCQPFKQAKDATRQFLRRIDFLRGDRVAFVTFDRSAYLINPDIENTGEAHMIESYERAVDTLDRLIGVRAEPNFYRWGGELTEDEGGPQDTWVGFAAGINPETGLSIPLDFDYRAGDFDINPDLSQLDSDQLERYLAGGTAAAVNYPAFGNCYIQNALQLYPFSLYATRNVPTTPFNPATPRTVAQPSDSIVTERDALNAFLTNTYRTGAPAMLGSTYPPYQSAAWQDTVANLGLTNFDYSRAADWGPILQRSYERHAMCNGANIGAALREASSALNDPRTSRRDGSVWIIILLSDGAAGRTDAVRSNGNKLRSFEPYTEIERFDYRNRTLNWPDGVTLEAFGQETDGDTNRYGSDPGEYGAYGLCPPGTTARVGNLVTGNPSSYPWCSPEGPTATSAVFQRHFCIGDGRAVGYFTGGGGTEIRAEDTPNSFGTGFSPNAIDRDYRPGIAANQAQYEAELALAQSQNRAPLLVPPIPPEYPFSESQWIVDQNVLLGNYFDVDIGDYTDPNNRCDPLYDPFDYARDWADFIAGVDEDENTTAQLPIIFTIGFGLTFNLGDGSCNDNVKDCLGEELLRYIADAGDNFRIDNDVHRDMRHNRDQWRSAPSGNARHPTLDGSISDDP